MQSFAIIDLRCVSANLNSIYFGQSVKIMHFTVEGAVSPPERCDLPLRNKVVIMYSDRYLSCFGIKIQIILANLHI